jgi:hypothetical protein
MYPECAQLNIIDGGSLEPTDDELVTFPGGYSNTDSGLTVNLYTNEAQTEATYQIPGPPLYAGAQSGSSGSSSSTSTVKTSTTSTATTSSANSTSTTVKTTSTLSTAAPTSTGTVQQYGQCGGQDYTGATTCVSGTTCTVLNLYYVRHLDFLLSCNFLTRAFTVSVSVEERQLVAYIGFLSTSYMHYCDDTCPLTHPRPWFLARFNDCSHLRIGQDRSRSIKV